MGNMKSPPCEQVANLFGVVMISPEPFHRKIPELIEALQRHTRLLRKIAQHAFQDQDDDYFGEVAGKLRLLVHERGSNKPLLLGLMDEFGLDVLISTTLLLKGDRIAHGQT